MVIGKGMLKNKQNRSFGGQIVTVAVLIIFAVFMAIPLLFSISGAFKPLNEIFLFPPRLFVMNPTLENFRELFRFMSNSWVPFSRYIFNSLFITALGTALVILISCAAAYSLSKLDIPYKKTLFSIIILALMLSKDVSGITNYIIMSKLHTINSYFSILFPAMASSFGVFLVKQFIDVMVPDSLLESAKMDGSNQYGIFWSIVMPIIKPAWLTLLIFTVQTLWNDTGVNIYSEQLKPLPYAMNQILAGGIARTGAAAAAALLIAAVPIVCFVVSQSNVIDTLATSGIKE